MATLPPAEGRDSALAAFDAARDAFLADFARAPDAALAYLPPGDDYALGVLPMHLLDPMRHYLSVFDLIVAAGFGVLDLAGTSEEDAVPPARHAELLAARPGGSERPRLLADLAQMHETVRQRALALDAGTFARQAPVIYSPGAAPYPTSFADILGWLTDHYHEHVAQIGQMLAGWQQSGATRT